MRVENKVPFPDKRADGGGVTMLPQENGRNRTCFTSYKLKT